MIEEDVVYSDLELLETEGDFDFYPYSEPKALYLGSADRFAVPEMAMDGHENVSTEDVPSRCCFALAFKPNFDDPIIQICRDYVCLDRVDPIRFHLADPLTYLRQAGMDV